MTDQPPSRPTTGARSSARLKVLTEPECWELLAGARVGRLGVMGRVDAAPLVVPVNYAVDGRSVVVRTGMGEKYRRAWGRPVSFQVDAIDAESNTGWSVLVRGRAVELTSWESAHLDIPSPVPNDATAHVLRIEPSAVTGRWLC